MTYGDIPASPFGESDDYSGLSIREYFAAAALQGILANPHADECHAEHNARRAVMFADNLIKALNGELK